MRLVLVADAFPPMRSSASIQLWDLAIEIRRLGHDIWVVVPSSDISHLSVFEEMDGINVLRLKARKTKDIGYIKRTVNEFLMPFLMIKNYRASQANDYKWDGVIWYSPTIFLGPVAWYLKKKSRCKSYLILRDIFPKWAVDLGIIKKGPTYYFFKLFEAIQYYVADRIGIQSKSDLGYLRGWGSSLNSKNEILNNWLEDQSDSGCSISIETTSLVGRKILVYAGNMGVAQNVHRLLDFAFNLRDYSNFGFLFLGRGDQVGQLKRSAQTLGLNNIIFIDEISPKEIPGLYNQCAVGMIALDPRHKTSNIPGKFISYMRAGLPVIALVNDGNELMEVISNFNLGIVCTELDEYNFQQALNLLSHDDFTSISKNCRNFYIKNFLVQKSALQILDLFKSIKYFNEI